MPVSVEITAFQALYLSPYNAGHNVSVKSLIPTTRIIARLKWLEKCITFSNQFYPRVIPDDRYQRFTAYDCPRRSPLALSTDYIALVNCFKDWDHIQLEMGEHDRFFLRDGDRLYFNRWHEDEDGSNYYDETVVRNLDGEIVEVLPGDIRVMPNGDVWFLK